MSIKIIGAKENNLKNINIEIPLNKLIVFTGVSGSGKSSLAFDTIHKEGQRRYLETFSSYARNFIGNFERPNVDHISGLSPVISIEQQSFSNNPRSTVGTTTEIYDYLRLLFAKIAEPVSFVTGKKMKKQAPEDIINSIQKRYLNKEVVILSPIIRGRKGHYAELFQMFIKQGYRKTRINKKITNLSNNIKLNRYQNHDIDILVDKLLINDKSRPRIKNSINIALEEGKGSIIIQETSSDKEDYFSQYLTCVQSGISYQEPQPNSFSFNSPKGYCNQCKGLGRIHKISIDKIIPDKSISIQNGAIKPIGEYKDNWIFQQIKIICKKYNFDLSRKIKDISTENLDAILYGISDQFKIKNKNIGITKKYNIDFEGIVNFIDSEFKNNKSKRIQRWANDFFEDEICDKCNGQKLKKESLHFLINKKNISEISNYDIFELKEWTKTVLKKVKKKTIENC